jgi:transposase
VSQNRAALHRLARLRRERESVGVVSPTAPVITERRRETRRVIGIDIHRTFGEVVIWEDGRLRSLGRVDMTRTALEGLGGKLLSTDEVVIEATGNCMAVSRVLSPFVRRVVIANPLQVKAIAHARVKTDTVDSGTLASLFAAGYLPEVWTPAAQTERKRRLTARRYQIVRHRTRIKNEVHEILHAHLIPKCPHADLFNQRGRHGSRDQ